MCEFFVTKVTFWKTPGEIHEDGLELNGDKEHKLFIPVLKRKNKRLSFINTRIEKRDHSLARRWEAHP